MTEDTQDVMLLVAFTIGLGMIVALTWLHAWVWLAVWVPLFVVTVWADNCAARRRRERRNR